MREGKNREVKNVLGHLGLAVNRLIRVSFGPFQLGDLPDGAVDEVRTRHLREQLGERVATAAGLDFAGPIEDQARQSRRRGRRASPRHPEARAKRASKGGHRSRPARATRPASSRAAQKRGHLRMTRARIPARGPSRRSPRRHGPDRLGEPERARRERKHGKRPFRGKPG